MLVKPGLSELRILDDSVFDHRCLRRIADIQWHRVFGHRDFNAIDVTILIRRLRWFGHVDWLEIAERWSVHDMVSWCERKLQRAGKKRRGGQCMTWCRGMKESFKGLASRGGQCMTWCRGMKESCKGLACVGERWQARPPRQGSINGRIHNFNRSSWCSHLCLFYGNRISLPITNQQPQSFLSSYVASKPRKSFKLVTLISEPYASHDAWHPTIPPPPESGPAGCCTWSSVFSDSISKPIIIDVRSPDEFNEDHIHGAINLPVLNNEERAIVGRLYNQGKLLR
ncbi:unnamed protein product [Schistosoma mattheei]|uniref:Uncharacterized protein n=1 Tax=Schistosoma mattheei TaxID=31246 RepID=A0A183PYH2_9TREM|nr:unnamed protein product [Schistosoma mattheei]